MIDLISQFAFLTRHFQVSVLNMCSNYESVSVAGNFNIQVGGKPFDSFLYKYELP